MFYVKTLGAALGVTLLTATGAFAQETYELYGQESGWNVFANKTTGGCFIESPDNNGYVVQMGIRTAGDEMAFVGIFQQGANANMGEGESRNLVVMLDDRPYIITANSSEGRLPDGYSGGYTFTNDPGFIEDVSQRYKMKVFTSPADSFEIDLAGSKDAIKMVRECYAAQNG
jgi:hypothetical protein